MTENFRNEFFSRTFEKEMSTAQTPVPVDDRWPTGSRGNYAKFRVREKKLGHVLNWLMDHFRF